MNLLRNWKLRFEGHEFFDVVMSLDSSLEETRQSAGAVRSGELTPMANGDKAKRIDIQREL